MLLKVILKTRYLRTALSNVPRFLNILKQARLTVEQFNELL
jgi:hypothetical protein